MDENTKAKAKKVLASPMFLFFFFLFLVFVFSEFREGIARLNASCLLLTGEIAAKKTSGNGESFTVTAFGGGEQPTPGMKKKKGKKAAAKKAAAVDFTIQELADFPKTGPVKALYVKEKPEPHSKKIPLAPPMREWTGEEWKEEKTEIRLATDGKNLFVFIKCFDKDPDNLVTKSGEGGGSVWTDDSIEFFVCKDRETMGYVQIGCSASGMSMTLLHESTNNHGSYKPREKPDFYEDPEIICGKIQEGYQVVLTIPLINIGIDELEPGDGFLMQVVRNYRGQGSGCPGSVGLHLFPRAVYGDKRGLANHDRRAFQPVEVISK